MNSKKRTSIERLIDDYVESLKEIMSKYGNNPPISIDFAKLRIRLQKLLIPNK